MIHPNNDTDFILRGLTNARTGAPIEGAAVSWKLLDSAGAEVVAGDGQQYEDGETNDYLCAVPAQALVVNADYVVRVSVSAAGGLDAEFDVPFQALRRVGVLRKW